MARKDWIPIANVGIAPALGVAALALPWWVTGESLGVPSSARHYLFGAAEALGKSATYSFVFASALVLALLGFMVSALARQPVRAQAIWAGAALGLGAAAAIHTALRWPGTSEFREFLFSADRMLSVGGAPHLSHAWATPGLGWFLAIAAALLPTLVLWRNARYVRG